MTAPRLRWVGLAAVLLATAPAHASGGGPLLPFVAFPSFLAGFVLGVPIEFLILRRLARDIGRRDAALDVVHAGALSATAAGLVAPVLVAVNGLLGSLFLSGSLGAGALAIGTWVGEGNPRNRAALWAGVVWFLILLVIKGIVEGQVLKRRWGARQPSAVRGAYATAWVLSSVSCSIALIVTVVVWRDLF